jgi:opacity protein-like surface antigen
MKKLTRILFVIPLLFSSNIYSVEITPLFGYRTGGEFIDVETNETHSVVNSDIYGLLLSFPYEQGKTYELYYSHQSSELRSITISEPAPNNSVNIPLTIDYLHFGGTAPISDEKNLKTFVSGGLGFTYLSPDFPDSQSDLRASFSIGVGLKWPITDRIALRLETRGLATLFNNNASIFCNGGCTLKVNGSLFFQAEAFAGVAFRF